MLEMPSMDKEAKLLKRNAIKKKLPLFALEQRGKGFLRKTTLPLKASGCKMQINLETLI